MTFQTSALVSFFVDTDHANHLIQQVLPASHHPHESRQTVQVQLIMNTHSIVLIISIGDL